MNLTEKRRAVALIKDRAEAAKNAVGQDEPPLELPKAIQAKADKIASLMQEVKDAGFVVNFYGGVNVNYSNDHPDVTARSQRREAERKAIKERAERIELDVWAGRIEDFAEVEAQADALVGAPV